jgi:hypothetical protein
MGNNQFFRPPLYIGIHLQKYSVAIPSFKKLKEYKNHYHLAFSKATYKSLEL